MIRRKRYDQKFKKQLAMEMISNESTIGQISKREGISYQTLKNWRESFLQGSVPTSERELLQLRQENSALRNALSDAVLANQILKKTEEVLQEMVRDGHLSEKDLLLNSARSKVAKQ